MIYLDYAATTPVDPRVSKAMLNILNNQFSNSASVINTFSKDINVLIDDARLNVANIIGTDKKNIIFTSGATESNNFIFKGLFDVNSKEKNHIITTKIEHKSILESCKYLEKKGAEITYLDVDLNGKINIDQLNESINKNTLMVSIMMVNNEIGSINEIKNIGEICKKNNVYFHSDLTQALGKIEINVNALNIDFASFSSHKIYGPKGIGAAYIGNDKNGIRYKVEPIIHGGKQEFSLRAGTSSNHDIVGFGVAAKIAKEDFFENNNKIKIIEEYLIDKLNKDNIEYRIIGNINNKVNGIINLQLYNLNNSMFFMLFKDEMCLSFGSACSFNEPSYVIKNIDQNIETKEIVRVSFGKFSKKEEIDILVENLKIFYKNYV